MIPIIRLFFHPKRESYFVLRRLLGFFPHNIEYYEEALIHKSVHGEDKQTKQSNERLEFLGDAVLSAIISDIVFRRYQTRREGFLSQTRSKIVKREMMDKIAVEIGLDKLITSSRSLKLQTRSNHISGNALEAFVGAVYLDRGYKLAYRFIEKKILNACLNLDAIAAKEQNYKSQLLEWAQLHKVRLEYEIVEQSTDEQNNFVFISRALLDGVETGKGKGFSRKASEQEAAKAALGKVCSL